MIVRVLEGGQIEYYAGISPKYFEKSSVTVDVLDKYRPGYNVEFSVSNDIGCVNPSISFSYEQIDIGSNDECIEIYDSDSLLTQCQGNGGSDTQCNVWWDCFNDMALEVKFIAPASTYLVSIKESEHNDALCGIGNDTRSINAKLTLTCEEAFQPCDGTGNGALEYCTTAAVYPSTETVATTVQIQDIDRSNTSDTIYNVEFSVLNDVPCIEPYLTFSYKKMDVDGGKLKYISIYNEENILIQQCREIVDTEPECGESLTCINRASLSIDYIEPSSTYKVFIVQPAPVESGCNETDYAIDANITLTCKPAVFVDIDITGCDNWEYESITNSLQMRLKGMEGSTSYFYGNPDNQLPTYGDTFTFTRSIYNIGDMNSVDISVEDENGFCISELSISYENDSYTFGADYFGSGLILAAKCKYSYKYIKRGSPLISCIEGQLNLNTYISRGIYDLQLHSCIGSGNGIAAQNMIGNSIL